MLLINVFSAEKSLLNAYKNNIKIHEGDIIFIDENAELPKLTLESPEPSNWKINLIFNRPNRNQFPPEIISVNNSKKIDLSKILNNKSIYGGLVVVYVEHNNDKTSLTFNIRGKNPDKASVLQSIGGNPWYAKAIAVHESGFQSGKTLLQFNEAGALGENYIVNIKNTPNRGNDMKGWGIFQITNPTPDSAELWNWKKNIETGKKIINSKQKLAKSYFDAVKRTYPDKYEPPPKLELKGLSQKLDPVDAASIQLYNGGSVIETFKTPSGGYSKYISCWKFIPENPVGQRWKFTPNRNKYVYQVISEHERLVNAHN